MRGCFFVRLDLTGRRKFLAFDGSLWSMARRPQDTALPEGNRSGGLRQRGRCLVSWCGKFRATAPACPAMAHWPKAKNSGGLGAELPRSRGCAMSRLSTPRAQAGSYAAVLLFAPFARTASRGGRGGSLVRDTGRQAVAAAVDGDDLGAVQQAVEDGSGGGHVA